MHGRVLVHLRQRSCAVCESQANPPLQNSQWATHLELAVQLGQTRGLFLLPGGRPLLLGGGGSGSGSAGAVESNGGTGSLNDGCVCGIRAGVGTRGAGAGVVSSSTVTGAGL